MVTALPCRSMALAITSSGAERPSQILKASAPWRTSTCSPVTSRAPLPRAERAKAVSP